MRHPVPENARLTPDANDAARIDALVALQRPGYSLARPFYTDPRIFERDVERVFLRQWLLAGHTSRIPDSGDYFLFDFADESLILIRGRDAEIRALLNVCRHRGSRVCTEPEGNVRNLVCPYHAWCYDVDGALISARAMPEGFDRASFGLPRAHLRVHEGLIFVSLADTPLDLDPAAREIEAFFGPHGLARAGIAARRRYAIPANWKLVVENFLECYHCGPSHKEYCVANPGAWHFDTGTKGQRFDALIEEWERRAEALGHKIGSASSNLSACPPDQQYYGFMRVPLEPGYQTSSFEGKPVAPLMGRFEAYDGGETQAAVGPQCGIVAYSDYALVFQFVPISAVETAMELTWLVDGAAREGADYDVERLTWLWDVTTRQDKKLTVDNQLGVNSRFYQPGPYSEGEPTTAEFTAWYLEQVA
jgi:Rieske 2Fe-2S family protein